MIKFIDLAGQRFGKLVATKRAENKGGRTMWLCKCDCGNEKLTDSSLLRRNKVKSCGCNNRLHFMGKTRFYMIWARLKTRCLNTKSVRYKDWGGRGIKICNRWLESFENFKEDMLESYLKHVEEFGEKQTTLDRINNNGDYSLENCRWATYKEQNENKRKYINQTTFIAISPDGVKHINDNQALFSKEYGLNQGCISNCLSGRQKTSKGWVFKLINNSKGEEISL